MRSGGSERPGRTAGHGPHAEGRRTRDEMQGLKSMGGALKGTKGRHRVEFKRMQVANRAGWLHAGGAPGAGVGGGARGCVTSRQEGAEAWRHVVD